MIQYHHVFVGLRPGGLGTPLEPVTPTAGVLANVYEADLACVTQEEQVTSDSPVMPKIHEIITVTPALSVVDMDRTWAGMGDLDAWLQRDARVIERVLGAEVGTWQTPQTVEALYFWHKPLLDQHIPEFGAEPNREILESLDLSSYSLLVERFRSMYRSVFFTHEPFKLPIWDALRGMQWNHHLGKEMMRLRDTEPQDSPFYVLERWWHHAVSALICPAMEEHLATAG